jgi:hypothetical protein
MTPRLFYEPPQRQPRRHCRTRHAVGEIFKVALARLHRCHSPLLLAPRQEKNDLPLPRFLLVSADRGLCQAVRPVFKNQGISTVVAIRLRHWRK